MKDVAISYACYSCYSSIIEDYLRNHISDYVVVDQAILWLDGSDAYEIKLTIDQDCDYDH